MNKDFWKSPSSEITAQISGLDFENPSEWPLVPRWCLLVGLYFLTVGLLWFYPLSDYAAELEKSVDKENTLRAEFTDKVHQAAMLHALKNQRDEVALTVEGLESHLTSSAETSSLLFSISRMGRNQNLQQELFRPDAPILKPYYAIIPVTFRAHGSYHDFARFAADVANLPRSVNLSNITIGSRPEGALTLETTVQTYRHLDPDEVVGQVKGAEVSR